MNFSVYLYFLSNAVFTSSLTNVDTSPPSWAISFTKEDDKIMFFAAIYQNNQFCIITREATEKISTIHHREPLIINQSQINNYLNIKKDAMEILNSIKPPALKFHEISKDVNNPINNDPALIKPVN